LNEAYLPDTAGIRRAPALSSDNQDSRAVAVAIEATAMQTFGLVMLRRVR
jgi:hypothetical protein